MNTTTNHKYVPRAYYGSDPVPGAGDQVGKGVKIPPLSLPEATRGGHRLKLKFRLINYFAAIYTFCQSGK